jgi:hypothetical protein
MMVGCWVMIMRTVVRRAKYLRRFGVVDRIESQRTRNYLERK